jgi:hypothetical protein
MSLDVRIRTGLNEDASGLKPATDQALDVILERGPIRRTTRTVVRSVGIAAVVSVFVAGGFAALRAVEGGGGRAGNGSIIQVSPIDGQWQMELTVEDGLGAGFGYGRARQLAGPRQLELALGVVRQIRPGSFQTVPVMGTFQVDGPFVFVRDSGETLVFRWTLTGNELHLTLVDDSRPPGEAALDRLIWTTHTWRAIG